MPARASHGRTQLLLIAAFGLIAALFITAQLYAHFQSRAVGRNVTYVAENALESIRLVGRMGHDFEREQLLIDRHIIEQEPSNMATVEKAIVATRADYDDAARQYEPLATERGEDAAWQRLQGDVVELRREFDGVLALSRNNSDVEARRTMDALEPKVMHVDHDVDDLIQINQLGVNDRMSTVRRIQSGARMFRWGIAAIATILTLIVGLFVSRAVSQRQRQVERFADQLQERNSELDAFAGRVAHDLGGPLNTIGLATGRLGQEAPQADATIAMVRRGVARMKTLIDDLLTLSRIDAQPATAVTETAVVATSIETDLASRVNDVHGTLRVAVEPARVHCTEGLLREVLWNLGENAVKYRRPDVPLELEVIGRANHGYEFRVTDNGAGMPPDEVRHAFEPFYRGTRVQSTPGTGLGLAIVKRVIAVSGGTVAIESTVGRGTTVVVTLPLHA
ncbi:MAG TPA: ATP-binding protein [Polyangiaceae bacterium]|nr:ATP-binding protein [Polyangiaceae bacterium]